MVFCSTCLPKNFENNEINYQIKLYILSKISCIIFTFEVVVSVEMKKQVIVSGDTYGAMLGLLT